LCFRTADFQFSLEFVLNYSALVESQQAAVESQAAESTTTTQAGDRLYSKEDIIDFCKKSGRELDELNFYTREELMEMVRKMREE
jgi:hypothetical protein